jgi:hypothetical protein
MDDVTDLVGHSRRLREQLSADLPNGVGNAIDSLCELVETLQAELREKPADPAGMVKLAQAVAFYADPESWHGVYMVGDGPMSDDWDEVDHPQYPDGKPGKLAREAVAAYLAETGAEA